MLPPPKLEIWEGPGFFPACAALVAVAITYVGLQRSTKKQIEAGAARTKEQLDHAFNQAKADREHSGAQANEERTHAARQATLDRLLEARQALYTQLIDDYVDVLRMFGSMASPDFRNTAEAVMPLMKMAASVNKTWLLSDVPTSHAVRNFYSGLNEMHFRLLNFVKPLQDARKTHADAVAKREMLRKATKDQKIRLDESLERANAAQRSSPEFDVSIAQQKENIASADTHDEELWEIVAVRSVELSDAHRHFLNRLTQEQNAMMKQINAVMAAARAELGLSGDIGILEEQSNVMAARVKAALAEFTQASQPVHNKAA